MQKIAIEPIGVQPLQRALASRDRAAPRGVARQHLRNQENVIAPAGDGVGDDQLGIAIHLRGVDMGHAEIEATPQRGDCALAIAAVDIPGALPDDGDRRTAWPEWS